MGKAGAYPSGARVSSNSVFNFLKSYWLLGSSLTNKHTQVILVRFEALHANIHEDKKTFLLTNNLAYYSMDQIDFYKIFQALEKKCFFLEKENWLKEWMPLFPKLMKLSVLRPRL
jgi:hypothetical protein